MFTKEFWQKEQVEEEDEPEYNLQRSKSRLVVDDVETIFDLERATDEATI